MGIKNILNKLLRSVTIKQTLYHLQGDYTAFQKDLFDISHFTLMPCHTRSYAYPMGQNNTEASDFQNLDFLVKLIGAFIKKEKEYFYLLSSSTPCIHQ